ncbi:MAG: hypothetical protein HY658_11310 [Actinobacteria bacterium]|nr:hypothetical protein [Actinomycetota bacterium]
MKGLKVAFRTTAPPDRVLSAFVDFSDRRPELWPNLSRTLYRAHDVGDGWAEVTEGSDVFRGIWARERYEWSTTQAEGRVLESNVFRPGSSYRLVVRAAEGGGTEGEVVWNKAGSTLKGRIIVRMIRMSRGRIVAKQFGQTLALLEEEAAAGAS